MSSGSTPVSGSKTSLFAIFVIVAIVVRLVVGSSILNLFVPYDLPGGGTLVKISPGTYLLVILSSVSLFLRKYPIYGALPSSGAVLCLGAVCALLWGAAFQNTEALGFLVDSTLCAGAAFICVRRLTASERGSLALVVILLLIANAFILGAEFITHVRVLPYAYRETTFRPTGLFAHPLINGLFYATAIPFVFSRRWQGLLKGSVATVFLLATLISGARAATLVGAVGFLVSAIVSTQLAKTKALNAELARLSQLLGVLTLLAFALAAGLSMGLGYRFENALNDQSAQTRVTVYRLLSYLSPHDLLAGAGAKRLTFYARNVLEMRSVESPVVFMIYTLGVPVAVVLISAMMWAMLSGLRRRDLLTSVGALVFVVAAASNNVLAAKAPGLVFGVVLVAACGVPRGRRDYEIKT